MSYRLSFADELPSTVRACAREQLERAAAQLENGGEDPVAEIHDARKRIKKTRSLLRLVRPALGSKAYRAENAALRDAAVVLSGTRDADVLVATVEKLASRFVGQLPAADFDAVRDALARDAEQTRAAATAGARAEVAGMLRAAAERVEAWPLDDAGWDVVRDGVGRAYARGLDAFAAVREDPTVERLHEWRKRVKDLWYHQRLLADAWPAVLSAQAEEAHVLSERLGDDHDLAVLRARLERGVELPAGAAADLAPLVALIDERRGELQAQAAQLGRRLYAERPDAFARRIWRYVRAAVRDQRSGAPA